MIDDTDSTLVSGVPMSSSATSPVSVSVCIPTYNQAPFLALAVQSVLAQDYPVREIIVADDASPDGTAAICEQFAQEHPTVFRYFKQPQNLGIEGNTDFVLRQATSTYIVRLDSDDRLLPTYVNRLVAAMQANPTAGYAHASIWEIDETGARTRLRALHRTTGFQSARDAVIASVSGYRVAANILCFRRDVLAQLDYTKGRGNFAEDYNLSVAIARAGYGNVYVAEPLAEYRVWTDKKGVRARRKEQELVGLCRVFDEQIQPAFAELALDPAPLAKARRGLALGHVVALDNPGYTSEDKSRLETHLIALGDSPTLRFLIHLSHWHLGFLWRTYGSLNEFARDKAKKLLRSLSPKPR
jgi:Glycosyl transferase family 2